MMQEFENIKGEKKYLQKAAEITNKLIKNAENNCRRKKISNCLSFIILQPKN